VTKQIAKHGMEVVAKEKQIARHGMEVAVKEKLTAASPCFVVVGSIQVQEISEVALLLGITRQMFLSLTEPVLSLAIDWWNKKYSSEGTGPVRDCNERIIVE
jgi:hypothetical protein